jgi:hypothetical protein
LSAGTASRPGSGEHLPKLLLNGNVPRMVHTQDDARLKNWRAPVLCGGCLFTGFLAGLLIFGSPWHLPPAWGDIPTWITAIATAGLLIGAIITAIYATRAFAKQSEQLAEDRKVNTEQIRVLELQATELQESLKQRQRETLERQSAQASLVFVWQQRTVVNALDKLPEHTVTVHVHNTSNQPVYDIWFTWQSGDTKYSPMWREKPLMPDETDFHSAPLPADADPGTFGPVVIFRDRAKLWWQAQPDGQLEQLPAGSEPQHSPVTSQTARLPNVTGANPNRTNRT